MMRCRESASVESIIEMQFNQIKNIQKDGPPLIESFLIIRHLPTLLPLEKTTKDISDKVLRYSFLPIQYQDSRRFISTPGYLLKLNRIW